MSFSFHTSEDDGRYTEQNKHETFIHRTVVDFKCSCLQLVTRYKTLRVWQIWRWL